MNFQSFTKICHMNKMFLCKHCRNLIYFFSYFQQTRYVPSEACCWECYCEAGTGTMLSRNHHIRTVPAMCISYQCKENNYTQQEIDFDHNSFLIRGFSHTQWCTGLTDSVLRDHTDGVMEIKPAMCKASILSAVLSRPRSLTLERTSPA